MGGVYYSRKIFGNMDNILYLAYKPKILLIWKA